MEQLKKCSKLAIETPPPVELMEGGGQAVDIKQEVEEPQEKPTSWYARFSKMATHGLNVDIHKVVDEDPIVAKIHESAEKFDPHVEYVFAYLQVRTLLVPPMDRLTSIHLIIREFIRITESIPWHID